MYQEIDGDLITLALEGKFDVIGHGVNCFCVMGAGIAPLMAEAFHCDTFGMELLKTDEQDQETGEIYQVDTNNRGDINKLGQIDYKVHYLWFDHPMKGNRPSLAMGHRSSGQANTQKIIVVNAYTQYGFGKNHTEGSTNPLDYEALTLCLRKMNHLFEGKHIGLPRIGCGLAGGDWNIVSEIIKKELKDCQITIVNYNPN